MGAPGAAPAGAGPSGTRTILVIEDDPALAEPLGAALNDVPGGRATVVGAVAAVVRCRPGRVDVLVTDVQLPGIRRPRRPAAGRHPRLGARAACRRARPSRRLLPAAGDDPGGVTNRPMGLAHRRWLPLPAIQVNVVEKQSNVAARAQPVLASGASGRADPTTDTRLIGGREPVGPPRPPPPPPVPPMPPPPVPPDPVPPPEPVPPPMPEPVPPPVPQTEAERAAAARARRVRG